MSQSLSQLWIHVVFSTKDRYPFLESFPFRQRLYDYIQGICTQLKCPVGAIGGVADHAHLLILLEKNISISKLIEEIKKSSSKWIKKQSPFNSELSKFYWQNGYGAFSVSQTNLEAVKIYILNQIEHHKKMNFQDELRIMLKKCGITYNEEYLWN